jgi:hypothetical protein
VSLLGVVVSLANHGWRASALVHMSSNEPLAGLAAETDPGFAFVGPAMHNDGVYAYAIARDPLGRGEAHTLIDGAAYRYGHAGLGWLAWIASAGQARAVPTALLILGLVGVGVAAVVASLIALELGWPAWGGLVAAFSPGLLVAVTLDTAEPIGVACICLALLTWMRARIGWAAVFLVAACLIKEPYVLVPVGLAAWEAVEWRRRGTTSADWPRLAALAAGPMLFAVWNVYLRLNFGVWSFQASPENLGIPVSGWIDAFQRAGAMADADPASWQLSMATVPLLSLVAVALLIGAARSLRLRSPLDHIFLLFVVLSSMYTWLLVLYPKELLRNLVVPLLLLPAVLAAPRAEGRRATPPPASRGRPATQDWDLARLS